jgi:hypothetical protein
VISPGRPRAPVRMVTMRTAAEDLAARLAAEQARAREAHEHLAEATAAHAAEAGRIERAEAQRDAATAQVGAGLAQTGKITKSKCPRYEGKPSESTI